MLTKIEKSNIKCTILTILVISPLFLVLIINTSYLTVENIQNKHHSMKTPNLSTDEITIDKPENKTYTAPMSGYYPATYGFEDDIANNNPKGWSYYELGGRGDIFVKEDMANHDKIIQFQDTGTSGGLIMEQFFNEGNQPNGSVEFWVRTDDAWKRFVLADLRLDPTPLTSSICFLQIHEYKFQYWDTSTYYDLGKGALSNQWYHIRIDFESSLGGYQNLEQQKWQIYIDGVKFGPYNYNNALNNAGWLRFESDPTDLNFNSYIDAIGYSWDNDYLMGDNAREGLLLSYQNSTALEWTGYSLDGLANNTISGNTTIPMPSDGSHAIQVFGNSSSGIKYTSEKRWFTINRTIQLLINTPENTTYTSPMSGYYPATYGFEEDSVNTNPKGWSFYEGGTRGDVFVNSSLANHNNIAQFKATGSSVGFIMEQFFKDGNQPNGSVELWVRTDDASKRFIFADLRLDPTPLTSSICFLQINGNKFQYWDTSTYYDLGKAAASNVWYHIRVDFECTLGNYQSLGQYKWQIYIDGVKFGPYDYNNDVSNAGWLRFESNPSVSNFNSYIDAIGYSWDSNYALGNNKNEGLLLSYTNSTALKWQGYSLDGQSNKTILGNTTIPMPMNGLHSIQMFGNDSLGRNYLSIVRRFTCNVPDISKPQFTAKTYDSDIFQGEYVSFTLKILDDYPDSYRIYRNGTLVRDSSSYTNNVFIPTFNELNWTAGTLEYTIEANDTSGNSNSTTITIMISQRPGYDFIKPNIITIILQEGLDIEFSAKQAGFLNVSQQVPEFNAGLVEARFHGYEITPLKYYNFTVFNLTLGEDESIINYVFIRFYYDPAQVEDETDLYLMHYVWSYENLMWVWEAETAIVTNADLNYIEWNTTDLSEFWLAEIRAPPGQEKKDDDDGDSTESSILVFFAKNMIIIVILSAIGVTIPSLYVAKSKKKKSALKEKSIGAVKSFDLAARAKEKKAALEKVTWKSEEAEPKKTKLEAKKIESTKLVAIELPKKKLKSKPETKPQENSEQEAKLKAKEVEETEKELELKEKLDICPVHKGTIEGVSYICPKCHAKYCLKCAKTLMENREGCWVCETAINAITDNQESIKKDATNTTVREKSKDLAEPNDNEYFLKLIQGDDGADRFDILKGYDFTVISKEFEEKVKQMDWDEEEKQKFLAEMISLTPMERERILDDMFRNEAELRKKKDKSPK